MLSAKVSRNPVQSHLAKVVFKYSWDYSAVRPPAQTCARSGVSDDRGSVILEYFKNQATPIPT